MHAAETVERIAARFHLSLGDKACINYVIHTAGAGLSPSANTMA